MRIKITIRICLVCIFLGSFNLGNTQSVAHEWSEVMLEAIRNDFARPTVHARNLFHTSVAMYDAWAVYDTVATTFLLGKNVRGFKSEFDGVPTPANIQAAREEAISYAAYRLLNHRFENSPGAIDSKILFDALFAQLGYDKNFTSKNYSTGIPAALGNYIASELIDFGMQDNANEQNDYANLFYQPVNPPLVTNFPGNPDILDPNRWQPLTLDVFIDQSGNEIPFNTPEFLSPEWGSVTSFALKEEDLTLKQRDGDVYWLYHDPGYPPLIDTTTSEGMSAEYQWNFALVSVWSSHLDPGDNVVWDISPGSIGNISLDQYPTTIEGLRDFYKLEEGGDIGSGHDINPFTGLPYEPQMVARADYGRVLAEFWADGPDSETPPGHWFTLLNYVNEHPLFEKRFRGEGPIIEDLEWDVKSYFMMGGAVHDCAITAWGLKGYYDYLRPISAIRSMAARGQSSDENLPSYHPGGIPLMDGYIELVDIDDPLAENNKQNIGKIKVKAWRGPDFIPDPESVFAGVDWILADNWWPYQRPTFVTPPFAGYVSGHSTFSRAAAEVMTMMTGDAFFPGGMGEFNAEKNEFLVFEEGPSEDIILQWATYRDASDQCSLSRIWGGIHPPADDVPGRLMGREIGIDAFNLAERYFFIDADNDGYFDFDDCDDNDASVNPGAPEVCNGLDNDCNGIEDDGLEIVTYFMDSDNDGFGDAGTSIESCLTEAPDGFVDNDMDCDDSDENMNPSVTEICDGIDNDCSGISDDNIATTSYYEDSDNDGYGNPESVLDTCLTTPPEGYVIDDTDCDDTNMDINPEVDDIPNNGIDEDCDGEDFTSGIKENNLNNLIEIFPNPVSDELTINYEFSGQLNLQIVSREGKLMIEKKINFNGKSATVDFSGFTQGVYFLKIYDDSRENQYLGLVAKN